MLKPLLQETNWSGSTTTPIEETNHSVSKQNESNQQLEHEVATSSRMRGIVVSGIRRMNKVNPRRVRLALGWVTIFCWLYHVGM